jgi:uncharacterized protein
VKTLAWAGAPDPRFEIAFVELAGGRLIGRGSQLGPTYRLTYEIETDSAFVTERFLGECETSNGSKRVELRRGVELVGDTLDVDLGFSPLFNSLPVLRDRLLDGGSPREYTIAFVTVPDLDVSPAQQQYIPIGPEIVRYRAGTFVADIEFDSHGFVVDYPGLARRLG